MFYVVFDIIIVMKIFTTFSVLRRMNHVTGDGIHLRGLAPGQLSFEEASQPWLGVDATVSDLVGPGIKPQISRSPAPIATPVTTMRQIM